ncbi:MAG: hypothetical protein Kow0010_19320 [Dehalococcoidia bacterium]
MTVPPYTVARYGLYAAITIAVLSAWLGLRAGASLDYAVLRGVIVFVIFAVLAFAAEAVLVTSIREPMRRPAAREGRRRDRAEHGERGPASD